MSGCVCVCVCICTIVCAFGLHNNLAAIGSAKVGRNMRENGAWNSRAGDRCGPQRTFESHCFQRRHPKEPSIWPSFHCANHPESAPSLDVAFDSNNVVILQHFTHGVRTVP